MLINVLLIAIAVISSCLFALYLFRYLRSKLPVKVNCWFCDRFHLVPYRNKNCWDCPHCEQYNGFNERTGDYNKPIPAQYDECLNQNGIVLQSVQQLHSRKSPFKEKNDHSTNGLCIHCNRNQLLKIKQLAQFLPQSDDHFDEEVELYRQHLEDTYKLCRFCEAVVHQTLGQQDSTLRSKVLSWRLQQKRKELSPQSKRLSWFSSHSNVPLKARVLRFISMHVAFFFLITYLTEIKGLNSVELYVPLFVVDYFAVLAEHRQLLVTIGFFSLIFAIFSSGRDKLMGIDAIGSFVWLAHLFLHTPPFVSVFVNVVDLRFIQIVSSLACFVITSLSFAWNRKRLVRLHSLNDSRLSLSCSSAGSECSSIYYSSAKSEWNYSLGVGDRGDTFSVSSKLSKSPNIVQDGSVTTTTTARTATKTDGAENGLRQCNLDNVLQAMKIGTPKKNEKVSGIFTCRPYKLMSLSSPPGSSQINNLERRRSVLSPPRFKNRSVTQSSWVAGGYWAKSNWNKFSDMNSGRDLFGGMEKTSRSCPVSRAGSVLCEDQLSVFSEPAAYSNRFNNPLWPNSLDTVRESASPLFDRKGSDSPTCSTSSEVSVGSRETCSAPVVTANSSTTTSSPSPPTSFWRSPAVYWVFGISLIFNILLIAGFVLR